MSKKKNKLANRLKAMSRKNNTAKVVKVKGKAQWKLLINNKIVTKNQCKKEMNKIAKMINESGEINDEIIEGIWRMKKLNRKINREKNRDKRLARRKARKEWEKRDKRWKKAKRCKLPALKADDPLTKFIAKNCDENKSAIILFGGRKYVVNPRNVIRAKNLVSGKNAETVNAKWRAAVMERDNRTCQHCGSNEKLNAHHILGRASNPELAEDVDNGIVLCAECHKRFHKLYGYTGFNQTDFIKFMKYDKQ